MMDRTYVRRGALALMLAVVACDDSATDLDGTLTTQEMEALAEVVAGTVYDTWGDGMGQAGAPARGPALATIDYGVEATAECEFGGTVAVTGDLVVVIDDETEELTSLEYTVTQDHQGCVAESQDGVRFTLNGAPDVTATLLVQTEGDLVSLQGGYEGGVEWSTEGRSGTCTLDVTFTADINPVTEAGSASMTGSVCGVTFSKSLDVN